MNPVDPDAQTFRKPGRAPILGHKTHFLVDGGKANIITAVESRAACEADGQAVGTLLDKHRAALGRQARELVGDRGYGSETALKDCVQRGVQPLLGIRTATNPHGGINREEFNFVPERDLYVCPQGKELTRFTENIFSPPDDLQAGHWCLPGLSSASALRLRTTRSSHCSTVGCGGRRGDVGAQQDAPLTPPGAAPAGHKRTHQRQRQRKAWLRQGAVPRADEDADSGAAHCSGHEPHAAGSSAARSPVGSGDSAGKARGSPGHLGPPFFTKHSHRPCRHPGLPSACLTLLEAFRRHLIGLRQRSHCGVKARWVRRRESPKGSVCIRQSGWGGRIRTSV